MTLVVGLLAAAAAPTVYAQATRIAVVDLTRAVGETSEGRAAQAKLKRLADRRQRQLNEGQESLKQLKQAFDDAPEAEQPERAEALQKAYAELQSKYVEYQRELAERESQVTRPILERMQAILRRLGQSEGYTLIVDRGQGGVIWSPSHLDITDQVIQAYEQEAPARPTKRRARRRGAAADD